MLVDLDSCHLLHQSDVGVAIAEVGELGQLPVEGARHAQFAHHRLQVYADLGLEARQLQVGLVHSASELPVLTVEHAEHVADGLSLARQQHGHDVGTVAVGQLQGLIGVVVHVLKLSERHPHDGHLVATAEHLVGRVRCLEGIRPCALEVERIQQIAHGFRLEVVLAEHFANHSLGVVAGPLVDDVPCQSVAEVARLGRGAVVLLSQLHEVRPQHVVLVQENIVGHVHARLPVELATLSHHLVAELVDGLCPGIAETQHLTDFLLRQTGGTVVQHAQCAGDAQRREQQVLLLAGLAEQAQGEVVVLSHQPALRFAQLDLFRRHEVIVGEKISIVQYIVERLVVADAVGVGSQQMAHQSVVLEPHAFNAQKTQHVGRPVGAHVAIAVAGVLLPVHLDGLFHRLSILESLTAILQREVYLQVLASAVFLIDGIHLAVVLAVGSIVSMALGPAMLIIFRTIHLHVLALIDDGVAYQHVGHGPHGLLRVAFTRFLKVVVDVVPRLVLFQHRAVCVGGPCSCRHEQQAGQ